MVYLLALFMRWGKVERQKFLKRAIPGLFFLYFRLFNTVDKQLNVRYKSLPITGSEPRISGVGSNQSTNWATTTARRKAKFLVAIKNEFWLIFGLSFLHPEWVHKTANPDAKEILIRLFWHQRPFGRQKIVAMQKILKYKSKKRPNWGNAGSAI